MSAVSSPGTTVQGSPKAEALATLANLLLNQPSEASGLVSRLRDALRDAGLALGHAESVLGQATGEWLIEPNPLVIDAAEWRTLEAACRQRARLLEGLLHDLYGNQSILRRKLLPPELVLSDPFFRRPCKGIDSSPLPRTSILRFDLVRRSGGWMFVQTHSNTPLGMFLSVQNRRLMTQEADALYSNLPSFHGVSDLPLHLIEALRSLVPASEQLPNVVVLSSGPGDPYYAEHSFLARKMGVPVAQGDDLIVLDNRLYFKSIEGLEPVDVIYRRLHDGHIDPVVFPTDRNLAGIAGLLGCIRNGTVRVANAIGSGLVENRGLHSYLPGLCRNLLGERPLLPSLPTFYCGDEDQLAHVLEAGDSLEIRPVHDTLPSHQVIGSRLRSLNRDQLLRLLRQHPQLFVGQEPVRADTHLSIYDGSPRQRPVRLSIFVIQSASGMRVIPGGLGVLAPLPDETGVSLQHLDPSLEPSADDRGGNITHAGLAQTLAAPGGFPLAIGLTCDVLVLRDDSPDEPLKEPASIRLRTPVLGSRAAENLFWLGRYAERAENSARMVALMSDVGLEDLAASERARWFPEWLGFLGATGHSLSHGRATVEVDAAAHQLVLDASNPSSVLASCELVHENARRARDFLSPECWRIISRLRSRLLKLTPKRDTSRESKRDATDAGLESALTLLPALHGTLLRTMPMAPGLRFLTAGARLERCITTAAALRHALREVEALEISPHASHPILGALVRLLVSQDAFLRAYQSPATTSLVVSFFLHNRESPQSIENGLACVVDQLELIGNDLSFADSPPRLAASHLRFMRDIPAEALLSGEMKGPLSDHVEDLLTRLFSLSEAIGDFYMNHQARFCA